MNDWIAEYFKRDLTESEEQELSERISASPEEAQRFARLMAEHYRGLGLPEPLWPEKPLPPQEGGFWGLVLPLALLVLALAMAFVFFQWLANAPTPPAPTYLISPDTPKASGKGHKSIRRMPAVQQAPVSPSPSPAPLRKKPGIAPAAPGVLPPPPPLPILPTSRPAASLAVPSRPSPVPGRLYEELSINVELPEAGLVTVKVLNPSQTTVRVVFAGLLSAGKRTFTWDGRTDAGMPAPAGLYTLQVQSGPDVMRRQVHLQADSQGTP